MNTLVFSYATNNIGDDIQTVATIRILEELGYDYLFMDRDWHIQHSQEESYFLIANGWYIHGHLPFPTNVYPLFLSVHLNHEVYTRPKSAEYLEYLKKYEPIGCRDTSTLLQLRKRGIKAYLSACLTLTLSPPPPILGDRQGAEKSVQENKTGPVFWVDATPTEQTSGPSPVILTHETDLPYQKPKEEIAEARIHYANHLLHSYSKASHVVTSRLHCALPCKAMGVPVEFIPKWAADPRFSGFEGLLGMENTTSPLTQSTIKTLSQMNRLIIDTSLRLGENVMRYVEELDRPDIILSELKNIQARLKQDTFHSFHPSSLPKHPIAQKA